MPQDDGDLQAGLTGQALARIMRVMGLHETVAVWTDREPTLEEELRALSEEDSPEMANLPPEWTGVLATLFISTAMGQHGPRVKIYIKTGKGQPSASISIGPNPRVLASSLDERDLARVAPKAIQWVALNHEALTTFWFEGESLTIADVADFTRSLKRV